MVSLNRSWRLLTLLGLVVVLLLTITAYGSANAQVIDKGVSKTEFVPYTLAVTTTSTVTVPTTFQEAPMLAALVEKGELPPLEERLPKIPRVLPVYEKIGVYGGTWRRAYSGIGDKWNVGKLLAEPIVKYYMSLPDETLDLVPNWCDDYQLSADAKTYTFHIREGLKWSDGVPVTTDDVKFWYEDVFQNTDLLPNPPATLVAGGEPLTVEIVDKYTFNVKFAAPNPLWLSGLAMNSTDPGLLKPGFVLPAHYLKNFLPKYASQADLDKIVADKQVKSWKELWGSAGAIQSEWLNPDMPTLAAWKVKVPPPAEQLVYERNPYYFAVDAEGNQLPYIDEITFDLFQDPETINLWAVQGKLDEQARGLDSANLPLYKQNEAKGDYRTLTWRSTQMQVIFPNLNVEDPILNKLFNDANFRQALNIAINRDEVQQIAWNGFGVPRQASPVPGTAYYDAEFSQKWTQYDAAAANKLLDGLGLTKKDADGYRLREDGKRLSITLVYEEGAKCNFCELVQKYWKDAGIELNLKNVDRTLFDQLMADGKADMLVWWWDRNNLIEADPTNYLGTDNIWAPQWGKWQLSQGKEGKEPPKDHPIRQLWAAWEAATSTSDPAEARKSIQEIVTIHKQNVWVIGLVGEDPVAFVASNRMHNVPNGLVSDEAYREEGFGQPAQYFLDPQ
ncbi:MAG: ABC transporter substrate-binding protein [Anaerolineae bacterium]|nr:ABC transporter substrate-binding protein [Anaerolineales bacterium]MCQ3976302.1 ABC transporter substrate-binding protein [Anaerolineae bacterium]